MTKQINENMIREAAYFLWEKAGRPDGSAEFFWMKACEQFFAPKKVAIKKPCVKKACVKTTVKAKPVAKPVAKVVAKPAVKVAVKPVAKVAKPVVAKKPAVKAASKPTVTPAPFYGSRK